MSGIGYKRECQPAPEHGRTTSESGRAEKTEIGDLGFVGFNTSLVNC